MSIPTSKFDALLRKSHAAGAECTLDLLKGGDVARETRRKSEVAFHALQQCWNASLRGSVATLHGAEAPPALRAAACHVGRAAGAVHMEIPRRELAALLNKHDDDAGKSEVEWKKAVRTLAETALAARSRAREAVLPWILGAPPDQAFADDEVVCEAEVFLSQTSGLARETRRFFDRERPEQSKSLVSLLSGILTLPGSGRREGAILRGWADDLRPLGFLPELSKHARVVGTPASYDPRVRVVSFAAPRDVRVAIPQDSLGLAAEVAGADALGRTIAIAVTVPETPAVYAWPLAGSTGRTLGVLFSQLLLDTGFLRRVRGLSQHEAEGVCRQVAALLLFEHRVLAATLVARRDFFQNEGALQSSRDRLERAIFAKVPDSITKLSVLTPTAFSSRVAARFSGMALHTTLREVFDEDWFRNPRAGSPLRAALGRGGAVCSQEFFSCCAVTPPSLAELRAAAVERFTEVL